MRIISQCGKYNFPYDQSIVMRTENLIHVKCGGEQKTFAKYSSAEKAEEAICELNDAYYRFMMGFYYHDTTADCTTTFMFPADEEIEVVRIAE